MRAKKLKLRKKPGWYIIFILVIIAGFYTFGISGKGIIKIWRLSRMKKQEGKTLNEDIQKREALKQEIEKLKNDSTYIEEIARKKHGMIKEDEEAFLTPLPDSAKKE